MVVVTAVCTQLAGNPMMVLCAVWVSHSRPRKVPEGELQEAIPGYRGATPGGFMKNILRTFPESTPYLFLARSQWWRHQLPFRVCCFSACYPQTLTSQNLTKIKTRISWKRKYHATWRISSESTLDLRLRELWRARTPPLRNPWYKSTRRVTADL